MLDDLLDLVDGGGGGQEPLVQIAEGRTELLVLAAARRQAAQLADQLLLMRKARRKMADSCALVEEAEMDASERPVGAEGIEAGRSDGRVGFPRLLLLYPLPVPGDGNAMLVNPVGCASAISALLHGAPDRRLQHELLVAPADHERR